MNVNTPWLPIVTAALMMHRSTQGHTEGQSVGALGFIQFRSFHITNHTVINSWSERRLDSQLGEPRIIGQDRLLSLSAVVFNLGLIEPQGSVSQSEGFGGGEDTHTTHMICDDTNCSVVTGFRWSRYITWPVWATTWDECDGSWRPICMICNAMLSNFNLALNIFIPFVSTYLCEKILFENRSKK